MSKWSVNKQREHHDNERRGGGGYQPAYGSAASLCSYARCLDLVANGNRRDCCRRKGGTTEISWTGTDYVVAARMLVQSQPSSLNCCSF